MRLWPCCVIGRCSASPNKPESGSLEGKEVVKADHPTSKKWYVSAMAVGALVLVIGGVLGILGLLQIHGVASFPPWLAAAIGTIGHTPHAWSLWTMAIGGNIFGLVSLAWGTQGLCSIKTVKKQQTLGHDNVESVQEASCAKPASALPESDKGSKSCHQNSVQDCYSQHFEVLEKFVYKQLQDLGFSEDRSVFPKPLPDTQLQRLSNGHYYVVRPKSDQKAQLEFWIVLKTKCGKTFWHAPLDQETFLIFQQKIQQELGFMRQSYEQQPQKSNFDLKIAPYFGAHFETVGYSKDLLQKHTLETKQYVCVKIPKKTDPLAHFQSQSYYIVIKTVQGQVLCTEAIDGVFSIFLKRELEDEGYREISSDEN